jgi:hypothetical protein
VGTNATKTTEQPETVTIRNGVTIEVLISDGPRERGMWWPAIVTGITGGAGGPSRVRARMVTGLSGGPSATDAILSGALYGKTWRLSMLDVYRVPLTGQGVRNLNMAAPPALRNGRHFRKPRNWIAICPHPDEAFSDSPDDLIEEPVYKTGVRFGSFGEAFDVEGHAISESQAIAFRMYFRTCGDCGAEVPA